jgi:hypothetical protein
MNASMEDDGLYPYHIQQAQQLLPAHAVYNSANGWNDRHSL